MSDIQKKNAKNATKKSSTGFGSAKIPKKKKNLFSILLQYFVIFYFYFYLKIPLEKKKKKKKKVNEINKIK